MNATKYNDGIYTFEDSSYRKVASYHRHIFNKHGIGIIRDGQFVNIPYKMHGSTYVMDNIYSSIHPNNTPEMTIKK